MAYDNTVTVVGNVTRDPELRYTPSGQTIATFGLAVNRRWQNRQTQEWEEQVSFFDIKAWANLAENVADSIAKGTRVIVTGRLEQRSWETDNGDKRSKVEVVADEVAPSLRWATAQVQKIERSSGGSSDGSSGGSSYGGGNSGGNAGGSNSGGGNRPAQNQPDNYGEEPF